MSISNNNIDHDNNEYNCYTYAFNIPNGYWQRPYHYSYSEIRLIAAQWFKDGLSEEEIEERLLDIILKFLIKKHGESLRILENEDDLLSVLEDEEIIQLAIRAVPHEVDRDTDYDFPRNDDESTPLFDYEIDYDFHFKVFRNGQWTEKCGEMPIQECEPWQDIDVGLKVFDTTDEMYNSRAITFAHKKII